MMSYNEFREMRHAADLNGSRERYGVLVLGRAEEQHFSEYEMDRA